MAMKLRGLATYSSAAILLLLVLAVIATDNPASGAVRIKARNQDPINDIQNATLGFEKIFVINLPSRTDHRDAMSLASSLTNLTIHYIDGVSHVDRRTLPPGGEKTNLRDEELGNWRAHLNAARYMVENDVQSALVLEDDADWDIRIRDIMHRFAKASRVLVQPTQNGTYLDSSFPDGKGTPVNLYVSNLTTSMPDSPYGDLSRWDLFWLGHCGTSFPIGKGVPSGRAVILDDETVPEPQHIHIQFGDRQLQSSYPPHTRVVTRAYSNTCTLGYALSLPGARRLLYRLGIKAQLGSTDMELRRFCEAGHEDPVATCLTVQPQIFQHHRPVGVRAGFSDISTHENSTNDHAFTRNIRWSTRLNLEKLMHRQNDYVDLYKDGEDPADDNFI